MIFHTWNQPVITWGEIWRVGSMCQHIPALVLEQILHIMTLRCFIVLEQNYTMLRQFWLFMVKRWPHHILQECALLLAIDCCTNWHRMVMHKSTSAEEHEVHDFQSILTETCNFLPPNVWVHHSAFFRFS